MKIIPIELSEKDIEIVMDRLENPPKPNKKLVEAYQNYKKSLKINNYDSSIYRL